MIYTIVNTGEGVSLEWKSWVWGVSRHIEISIESWRCRSKVQDQVWAKYLNWGVISKWKYWSQRRIEVGHKDMEEWGAASFLPTYPHPLLYIHLNYQFSLWPGLTLLFPCHHLFLSFIFLLQDLMQVPIILWTFPLSSHLSDGLISGIIYPIHTSKVTLSSLFCNVCPSTRL